MKKKSENSVFVCQDCGTVFSKWRGKCDACHAWNTIVEEIQKEKNIHPVGSGLRFENLAEGQDVHYSRILTGMDECDRVWGGGLVAGSVSLLTGEPGIGKSTLLLQIAARLAEKTTVIYITGEESAAQIRLRAKRLGVASPRVHLLSTTCLDDALTLIPGVLMENSFPGFVIVDSIQTMCVKDLAAQPGTVSQIRETTYQLITLAKATGIAMIIVGHVTKEGAIAGPKMLEHMVDTVLSFEGDHNQPYRLLRTVKNRYGATHEVGVFDMSHQGLCEVKNPSALFLSTRKNDTLGSCVFGSMEGTRCILVEVQALSTPSFLPSPRRAVVGWDYQRLSMILAVLESKCGFHFSKKDVFLTVLGGIKIHEPAADLCVALALLSCFRKKPLPQHAVALGEIGLTGEIYPPSFAELRIKEAVHLGFKKIFIPHVAYGHGDVQKIEINHVRDLDFCFQS